MGLFDPIWMTREYKKRDRAVKAVGKITDPDKLIRIATTAPENEVRVAAVRQLRDEQRLAEVAMTALPKDTSYKYSSKEGAPAVAALGIRDEALLGKIALTSPVEGAQQAAVERIESQPLLARIALESANKYAADDAARKIRDPELALRVAMSGRKCSVHCAYVISDPEAIRKVALSAPRQNARYAAVTHLKDTDALIQVLAQETDRHILLSASSQLSRNKKEAPLTAQQRERLVQAFIRKEDDGKESGLGGYLLDEPEDLRRVLREAARDDFKADAFARLADGAKVGALPELYMEAVEQARKTRSNWEKQKAWRDAAERIERRVINEESDNPDLLMAFVWDVKAGPNMASRCIHRLFDGKLDGHGGIHVMRDMAVKAFLDHIPEYGKLDSGHNEKYCILALAPGLPAAAREKYGFTVSHYEREDEDQFGRNTVNVTCVEWQGKRYSYP